MSGNLKKDEIASPLVRNDKESVVIARGHNVFVTTKQSDLVFLHSNKGQVLPLVALVVVVLSMFSILVWNLGMLELNRQKMQTAADAAALSAVRCRAAFLNKTSELNAGTHLYSIYMFHNIKEGGMFKGMMGPFQAHLTALKAMNQGAGGGPYLTGYQAAKMNGADSSIGKFVKGGSGTGMKSRKMRFTILKMIGHIPVPWPPFRKTYDTAYYCRIWENSYRNAQPDQEMEWVACKNNETYASSLIGLQKPAQAMAIAQAKVWLNVKKGSSLHNGGFPRDRDEGGWGWGVEPICFWPQFDARLVPVQGGYQH
ncbi:MAG: pilus assembly protein TadG-related protein [Elusimicrobia bacterium]|nr:pilus assembly protein TadG-related protein [Elusimicrobiota bacterium]